MPTPPSTDPFPIGFGLDRDGDIQTLLWYIRRMARPQVLEALLPRMTDAERLSWGEMIAGTLRRHLSSDEYHQLIVKPAKETGC